MSNTSLPLPEPARRWPQPDAVWLAIAAVAAVLAVVDAPQLPASAGFVVAAVLKVAPLFLVSIALIAASSASGADHLIAKAFTGRTGPMIVAASLMGALSPFCSCGVVPLIAALLAIGVPLPAVMAFWLASPLMDPAMFLLTAGVLGVPFAIAKTVAAVGVGLLGGFGVWALAGRDWYQTPLREGVGDGGCAGARVRHPKPVMWRFWQDPARRAKAWKSARDNTLFLGKMLVLAFVLESLMVAYVPAGLVAGTLGGEGLGAILAATAVGIPAYLNGTAALPLVRELMSQGMAPGAGLAFLVAGGVTSIPAALAVWAVARPPVFAAYLGFAVVGAVLSGLAWQAVAPALAP